MALSPDDLRRLQKNLEQESRDEFRGSSYRDAAQKRLRAIQDFLSRKDAVALREIAADVRARMIETINNRTTLPVDEVVTKVDVGEKISLQDLKEASKDHAWGRVLSLAFKLFFGKGNEVKGLGYFVKGLTHLPLDHRVGALHQIEGMDQKGMDWQKKMKTSLLRSVIQYKLCTSGYLRERQAVAAEGRTVRVGESQTLRDLTAPERWKEIEERKVLGPLSFEGTLPAGSFVYFDDEGYPLFLSDQSDLHPSFSIFRKQETGVHRLSLWEKKMTFLFSLLRRGDVLFVNEKWGLQGLIKKMFVHTARLLQASGEGDEGFFAIHVMVYLGDGKIVHVAKGGGHQEELAELFRRKYSAISVGRVQDPAKAETLTEHAVRFASGVTRYDYKGLVAKAKEIMGVRAGKAAVRKLTPSEKAVCVEVVQYAGQQAKVEELHDAESALDMFKAMKIEYSLNL